jgi:hypothetical protein
MIDDHKILSKYLRRRGYIVYPDELKCGYLDTPNYPHRWVDVVAYRNTRFYAFEYKSSGDPISGALKQIENYRHTFDYVILVVEVPRRGRTGISLNSKRGKKIYQIISLGSGVWTLSLNKSKRKFLMKEIAKPKLQNPNSKNRAIVEEIFRNHSWGDKMIEAGFNLTQNRIDQFL